MNKLKNAMIVLMIATAIPAHSQEPYLPEQSCHATLQLCDKALRDQIKITDLQAAIVEDMGKRYLIVAQQNQQLKEDANSWFRNPWVTGAIGFGLGALVMGAIKK